MNWYKTVQADAFETATKRQLVAAMVAVKGTLIDDGGNISCIAPVRCVWNSTGGHELNVMYERGWKKGEVYHSLLKDVSMGVGPCEDPECEWCNEGEPGGLPYGTNPRDCIVLNGVLQSGGAA